MASKLGGKPVRNSSRKSKTPTKDKTKVGAVAPKSLIVNQRNHIVRVKVLGLAGITVQPKHQNNAPNIPPPSNLKAIIAFSRSQKVQGTSPPSLSLVPSPATNIVLVDNQPPQIVANRGSGSVDEADGPSSFERYIAVWGDSGPEEERATVFETTLHRSLNGAPSPGQNDDASIGGGSVTSSAFTPKSFEVTIALGDERSKRAAFSVGVATLAISGDECTKDGMAKILDLPVLSLEQAQPIVAGAKQPWLPIIAMKPTVDESDNTITIQEENPSVENVTGSENQVEKKKKKKGFSRLFGKKKKEEATNSSPDKDSSINKLMTTSDEKVAFSQIYGIDPSDAVLRVSIEVYEKGSAMEKLFEDKRKQEKFMSSLVIQRTNSTIPTSGNNNKLSEADAIGVSAPEVSVSGVSASGVSASGVSASGVSASEVSNPQVNAPVRMPNPRSKALVEDYSDDDNSFEENTCSLREDGDSATYDYTAGTYANTVTTYSTNTNTFRSTFSESVGTPKKKSILNDMFGGCAPCGPTTDTFADEGSYYTEGSQLRRKEHKSASSQKKESEAEDADGKHDSYSSPRGVDDMELTSEPNKTLGSTANEASRDATTLSYSNSLASYTRKSNKSASVMQTIKDVLNCSTVHQEEDDYDLQYDDIAHTDDDYNRHNPPTIIDSTFETESIGDLTEITFDYHRRRPVKTEDLDLKISPNYVLAERGKALAGRILLPAAFGGDGLCVSHGRLVPKNDKEKPKNKKAMDEYERIFFRQQKPLGAIEKDRQVKNSKGSSKSGKSHDSWSKSKDDYIDNDLHLTANTTEEERSVFDEDSNMSRKKSLSSR